VGRSPFPRLTERFGRCAREILGSSSKGENAEGLSDLLKGGPAGAMRRPGGEDSAPGKRRTGFSKKGEIEGRQQGVERCAGALGGASDPFLRRSEFPTEGAWVQSGGGACRLGKKDGPGDLKLASLKEGENVSAAPVEESARPRKGETIFSKREGKGPEERSLLLLERERPRRGHPTLKGEEFLFGKEGEGIGSPPRRKKTSAIVPLISREKKVCLSSGRHSLSGANPPEDGGRNASRKEPSLAKKIRDDLEKTPALKGGKRKP